VNIGWWRPIWFFNTLRGEQTMNKKLLTVLLCGLGAGFALLFVVVVAGLVFGGLWYAQTRTTEPENRSTSSSAAPESYELFKSRDLLRKYEALKEEAESSLAAMKGDQDKWREQLRYAERTGNQPLRNHCLASIAKNDQFIREMNDFVAKTMETICRYRYEITRLGGNPDSK
jgi:hypothetical protein